MQVISGRPARSADISDNVALIDLLTYSNCDRTAMRVNRGKSTAVVDYDVVSVFLPLGRKFGGMLLLGEKFRPVRACDVRADGLCRGRDGKSGGEGQGQEFF